jgi:hypothetical protein
MHRQPSFAQDSKPPNLREEMLYQRAYEGYSPVKTGFRFSRKARMPSA